MLNNVQRSRNIQGTPREIWTKTYFLWPATEKKLQIMVNDFIDLLVKNSTATLCVMKNEQWCFFLYIIHSFAKFPEYCQLEKECKFVTTDQIMIRQLKLTEWGTLTHWKLSSGLLVVFLILIWSPYQYRLYTAFVLILKTCEEHIINSKKLIKIQTNKQN